ncbi:MAG: translation initiation factor IF-2 [Patescibacteria group bacterium]|nr:translation initiation factor IF-2 [Patescibacteria group bacterium]
MNVSELARKLRTTSKELLEILPAVGFDIGKRAIKIDDRQAQRIMEQWSALKARYRDLNAVDEAEEKNVATAGPVVPTIIALPPLIRVKEFAEKLKLPLSKVMAELMKNGVLSSMNEQIDFDTAAIVGSELGFEIIADTQSAAHEEKTTSEKLEKLLTEDDKTKLLSRAPVVVVMGHVDHGKTKLLDTIRQTNVVAGESGGITQHIGAYQVVKKGQPITFIDTPGHEAFTTMRSRGARIADIAILVIAADDSIQPQTKESIKIIKSAELPMIVAINKIDKPDANIEKVKQDLATLNLMPEDWGGQTICVPISAKAGTGIDELLEMILLVAETEKDKIVANPNRLAVGTIIESHINRNEGPVATALVQNGTLRRGDLIEVTDTFYGKIRAMKDFLGRDLEAAPPSTPVKIIGLKAAPSVGDVLQVIAEIDKKHQLKKYQLSQQATDYSRPQEVKKEEGPQRQTVNVVLKSDVLGSLEAIIASLNKLEHPEVGVNIIFKGLGNITESDIERANSSKALVYGFHVKPNQAAELLAEDKKIEIKLYDIIYQLLDDAKARLEKILTPNVIKNELGRIKVLAIFRKDVKAVVVGGSVTKGRIIPNAKVDVLRNNHKVTSGYISQLQSNKVSVNEVTQGKECGLKFEGKPSIDVGDVLDVYTEEVTEKKLG